MRLVGCRRLQCSLVSRAGPRSSPGCHYELILVSPTHPEPCSQLPAAQRDWLLLGKAVSNGAGLKT